MKHEGGLLDLIWIYWNLISAWKGGGSNSAMVVYKKPFWGEMRCFLIWSFSSWKHLLNGTCRITFWKRKIIFWSVIYFFWIILLGDVFLSFLSLIYQDSPFQEAANWFRGSQNALKLSKSRFHLSGRFERESYKSDQTIEVGDLYVYIYICIHLMVQQYVYRSSRHFNIVHLCRLIWCEPKAIVVALILHLL